MAEKGQDPTHHKFTETAYEELFNIAHSIWEKLTDLGDPIMIDDNETYRKDVSDTIAGLKSAIEDSIGNDKPSIWADNMLRGIVDGLESLASNANSFVVECEQEEKET